MEADEALDAAKAADAAIANGTAKGPLAGVPLAHKDMFDRKGKIASWGARIHADKPAAEDATVLVRFKASGALQVAALHLTEFAFGPTGHNYVLGHAHNPWDPTRIAGGSSAGAITAGLGSDTGGSLRLPAAAGGITSIKPIWGRGRSVRAKAAFDRAAAPEGAPQKGGRPRPPLSSSPSRTSLPASRPATGTSGPTVP